MWVGASFQEHFHFIESKIIVDVLPLVQNDNNDEVERSQELAADLVVLIDRKALVSYHDLEVPLVEIKIACTTNQRKIVTLAEGVAANIDPIDPHNIFKAIQFILLHCCHQEVWVTRLGVVPIPIVLVDIYQLAFDQVLQDLKQAKFDCHHGISEHAFIISIAHPPTVGSDRYYLEFFDILGG